MATTTLKRAVKKITDTFSGADDGEPEVYFIDEYGLKQWEREINPCIESGNNLLFQMKKFYAMETIAEFFAALTDPFQVYKTRHKIAHSDQFAQYDALGIEFTISVPKGFESVVDAAKQAQRYFKKKNQDYFAIKEGELQLTDAYYNRRNSKCYLTADKSNEKEALNFCRGVIESIEKIEPILARDPKNKDAIIHKSYTLPLPYFLKIVNTPSGPKLIPNPSFIKDQFGGTAHLRRYIPTAAEKKLARKDLIPNLGKRLKRLNVHDQHGFTGQYILCNESEIAKYEGQRKDGKINVLQNGDWSEQGRPYGTPLEFRQSSMKTPPTGRFEN